MTITENEKTALDFYKEMWIYRHKHFWGLVVKNLYICLSVILFPNLIEKIVSLPQEDISYVVFRIAGIILSVLFCYLLLCENARMSKTSESISEILTKIDYPMKKVSTIFKTPIGFILPMVICLFNIAVAVLYLIP